MEGWLQDLRHAFRRLARDWQFTAAAAVTLALAIGPTAGVLTLVERLTLRPLPGLRAWDQLVAVRFGQWTATGGFSPRGLSYRSILEIEASTPALAGLAGRRLASVGVEARGRPATRVGSAFVMANYFRVLGVQPTIGRAFLAEEDLEPGGARVAVISHQLWRALFGSDPSALGEPIRVNRESFTVIGVAPPRFRDVETPNDVDLWLPGTAYADVLHLPRASRSRDQAGGPFYDFVGRLAEEGTAIRVEQQLKQGLYRLRQTHPADARWLQSTSARVFRGLGIPVMSRERVRTMLYLLMGSALLLLLIATSNVANLSIFRAVHRRREQDVRLALGASRARVARLFLGDGFLVGLLGGVLALLLSSWLVTRVSGLVVPGVVLIRDLAVDWRVAAVTLGLSVITGVLSSVAPVTLRVPLDGSVLHASGRTLTRRTQDVRKALTVGQLAVSLVLVVGTLFFVATLRNYRKVDLGFDRDHVTAFVVNLGELGYTDDLARLYYEAVVARTRALPGVQAVSLSQLSPFSGMTYFANVHRPRSNSEASVQVSSNAVSSEYFNTLGIVLVRGRTFRDDDFNAGGGATAVVLNETLARRLFGEGDPLGQELRLTSGLDSGRELQIVGVASDSRWSSLVGDEGPFLYEPFDRSSMGITGAVVLVRSNLRRVDVIPAVRAVMQSVSGAVPLLEERSLASAVDRVTAEERLSATVFGYFALLGLTLASVGLYGLVANGVAERTREFGLRMAVGATSSDVIGLVIRESMGLLVVGLSLGALLSIGFVMVFRSKFYGVSAGDLWVYGCAAGVLVVATLGGSLLPARSATRVDPVEALRAE